MDGRLRYKVLIFRCLGRQAMHANGSWAIHRRMISACSLERVLPESNVDLPVRFKNYFKTSAFSTIRSRKVWL